MPACRPSGSMKRVRRLWAMLVAFFPTLGLASAQQPSDQIFPQIFHLNRQNTSIIHVQNPGSAAISVTVEFYSQQGDLVGMDASDLASRSSIEFPAASNGAFVGTAAVQCSAACLATAQWSLTVTAGNHFEVGVLPQPLVSRSRAWSAPVPQIEEDSLYGFAVYNSALSGTVCEIVFRDLNGEQSGSEDFQVPAQGQIAQFARTVEAGFVGGATITCDREVIAIALTQDQRNGFPTSLNYVAIGASENPAGRGRR